MARESPPQKKLHIYLLTKYTKRVLWRVAVRLSYVEDARCLKVNGVKQDLLAAIIRPLHFYPFITSAGRYTPYITKFFHPPLQLYSITSRCKSHLFPIVPDCVIVLVFRRFTCSPPTPPLNHVLAHHLCSK